MKYILAILVIIVVIIAYSLLNWISQGVTIATGVPFIFYSMPLLIPAFMLIWMRIIHPEIKEHKTIKKVFFAMLCITVIIIIFGIIGSINANKI